MSIMSAAGDAALQKLCPALSWKITQADMSINAVITASQDTVARSDASFVSQLGTLSTQVTNATSKMAADAAAISVDCDYYEKFLDSVIAQCKLLGDTYSKATGKPNPITAATATLPKPPWTTLDWLMLIGVAVGGYYAYKVLFGDRPLFGGDTIPKRKLPRYAGGSRR